MFVAKGARQKLLHRRREQFVAQYIEPLLREAENLGMTQEDVVHLVMSTREEKRS